MKKQIAIFILGLAIGIFSSYLYYHYKYKVQLEEAKDYEATQALNVIEYGDVTNNVEITCNFGNNKTFSGDESGLKFSQHDFDSTGQFVGYDKNDPLQKLCAITDVDAKTLIDEMTAGEQIPSLFSVVLSK